MVPYKRRLGFVLLGLIRKFQLGCKSMTSLRKRQIAELVGSLNITRTSYKTRIHLFMSHSIYLLVTDPLSQRSSLNYSASVSARLPNNILFLSDFQQNAPLTRPCGVSKCVQFQGERIYRQIQGLNCTLKLALTYTWIARLVTLTKLM